MGKWLRRGRWPSLVAPAILFGRNRPARKNPCKRADFSPISDGMFVNPYKHEESAQATLEGEMRMLRTIIHGVIKHMAAQLQIPAAT